MAHVVTPITRLLVANRGEIARRIMRTAHDMGIATVAVYADSDAQAPFVTEADTAVALNGSTSLETYLDIAKVIDACRISAADAVHPGYGFLSENAEFAQAVIDAGLRWLGPSPDVIAKMGDKLSAKAIMQAADVPTLAAVAVNADTDVTAAAQEIGYPILVKATAGGGGRGMRVVENPEHLAASVDSARREAGSSFGNDTVFLEKWLASARHVELQILGDLHGNLVHCFERECSIQRRHQKIIEEAPSPAVSEQLRQRMGDAAIAAARELSYASAGTVEFLVAGDEFWFLEVNARLQVEHPVTEEIIGFDLVREQIRIAEGEPLSFTQEALTINGHAIEARLYAEDPANDFLPSPGTVLIWEPSQRAGARFDSGVESGSVVSPQFDPMIAKVIVHAPTRREAAARLARVLETTRIHGLTTNRDFLVSTLRTPQFIAGDTTTDFIERVAPAPVRRLSPGQIESAVTAVVIEAQARRRAAAKVQHGVPSGWRNSTMPAQRISFDVAGQVLDVEYERVRGGEFKVVTGGVEKHVGVHRCGEGNVDIAIDGQRVRYKLNAVGDTWLVQGDDGDFTIEQLPKFPVPGAELLGGGLMAPMPGAVLTVAVDVGAAVTKGQLMLILEAMKMEHRITAPKDGTVDGVHVAVGDQVENGQLLVTLIEEDA